MNAVDTHRLHAGTLLRRPWSAGAFGELLEAVRDPAMSRRPWRGITLTTPVDLDAGDWATAHFVALLSEAIARGVPIAWELGRVEGIDPRQLVHLPPPSSAAAAAPAGVAEAWRASHRYGLLFYRLGPGFTAVKDTRHLGAHARFTIVDPEQVDDFGALVDFITSVGQDAPPATRGKLARALLEENLAVEIEGNPVPLPFRMRIWPVPYVAV